MNSIQILPEEVINQISAGEVVDRPASVVKEFAENSLDAGATQIYVSIQNGGKELISVADNGHGMTADNAKLAIERHATSKISNTSDLDSIQTMGFRGEALAAVASVSKMELSTCAEEGQAGTKLEIEGGQLKQCQHIGFPKGTKIVVKQLFFNTPARLKFMKTIATEFRVIQEQLLSLALFHHHIHFRLIHNNKPSFDLPAKENLSARAYQLFQKDFGESVFPVFHEESYLHLEGLFSLPSSTKHSKSKQYIFVNGRHIRSPEIIRAVYQSYGSLIESKKHPLFILKISIDPSEIDVNVHPAKTEIRFRNLKVVTSIIEEVLIQKIRMNSEQRYFSDQTKEEGTTSVRSSFSITSNSKSNQADSIKTTTFNLDRQLRFEMPSSLVEISKSNQRGHEKWTAIVQLQERYILAQTPKAILCIDQEIASKVVLQKRFQIDLKNDTLLVHTFYKPILMELAPHRDLVLTEHVSLFQKQGLTLEKFGSNTYRLLTAPDFLKYLDCCSMIQSVIDQAIESKLLNDPSQIMLEIIKQASQLAAYSMGQILSPSQMDKLLQDMQQLQILPKNDDNKLVFIEWTYDKLEKEFSKNE